MNLNDILDQLKDQLKTTWDKIQESSAYQQAMEKYEDLPSSQQRMIRLGGGVLLILFILSPPISSLLSSQEVIEEYERKRTITRELLQVVRDSANAPNILPAPDLFSLQNRFQQDLQNDRLLPEQIYSIQSDSDSGKIIPQRLSLGALSVNLKNLNLRQIVDIAHRLSSVTSTLKMTELEMTASPDKPGYFHFTSKLVSLKTPPPPPPPEVDAPRPRGSRPPGAQPKNQNSSDEESSMGGSNREDFEE